jgi:hypothetical protein
VLLFEKIDVDEGAAFAQAHTSSCTAAVIDRRNRMALVFTRIRKPEFGLPGKKAVMSLRSTKLPLYGVPPKSARIVLKDLGEQGESRRDSIIALRYFIALNARSPADRSERLPIDRSEKRQREPTSSQPY